MSAFNGLGLHLGNLSRLSTAQTRSCSPENPTGAKGQGGRHVDPAHGPSRDLGTGWKVRVIPNKYPALRIEGDIDPRGRQEACYTVSDKARAVGGAVLEAILNHFNR